MSGHSSPFFRSSTIFINLLMDATTFVEIRRPIEFSLYRLIITEYPGRGVRGDQKMHFTPEGQETLSRYDSGPRTQCP